MWKDETLMEAKERMLQFMAGRKEKGLFGGEPMEFTPTAPSCDLDRLQYLGSYKLRAEESSVDEELRVDKEKIIYNVRREGALICFTEYEFTRVDLCVKREKSMKIGKFYHKYFTNGKELTSTAITSIRDRLLSEDKTYWVYLTNQDYRIWYVSLRERTQVESCMDKPASFYDNRNPKYIPSQHPRTEQYLHPVDIYSTSDKVMLALICKERLEGWQFDKTANNHPIVGRAIVNEYKRYATVYPKNLSDVHRAMRETLKGVGFKQSDETLEELVFTAKENSEGIPVVPYFDEGNMNYCAEDNGDGTWEIEIDYRGDHETDHETGRPKEMCCTYCEHCGSSHSGETDDYYNMYGSRIGYVVGDCQEDCAHVEMLNGYVHEDYVVNDINGDRILLEGAVRCFDSRGNEGYVHENNLDSEDFYCLTEEYDDILYAHQSQLVQTEDGEFYLREEQADLYYEDAVTGNYYSTENTDHDCLMNNEDIRINLDNLN